MIEENLKNKVENMQRLIKVDLELVEELLNELHKLKSNIMQQVDELISTSREWINNLIDFKQHNSKYSFFDELDTIINGTIENSSQDLIIQQITTLNHSLCKKIDLKILALRKQELYSQCDKILINLNLIHNMKLIDNSNKQNENCFSISFNQSGSIMISANNSDINIWDFEKGKLNKINKISGHTQTICCLQFSLTRNSFVSAGFDKSIRCWKQINQKEWQSSQPYQQHTNCIDCLIFNQSENQLVSGGRDNQIKVWKIDFVDNQLNYLYSLEKHSGFIFSLCFNQSEDTLVSCGGEKQIIIWKKDSELKWQFGYIVTQSIKEVGCRLCFINDSQFIWVTGDQVSKDCISFFELKEQRYQENLQKEVKLIQNDKLSDLTSFPIFYDKKKKLMIVRHKLYVYLIKISNEGQLKLITQIKYESNSIQGALTNDGKYLVTWNKEEQKYNTYELYIN
ncbi:unnamed protein product [Paramecium octaurelia]|uniref:Uncharacterized protein n=1 Tax=Paramecium octaurelia TaxID=43137 RepID=A0A8S1V414_PAROT|nr:unnamed protein product [Paramecium octaurelia]